MVCTWYVNSTLKYNVSHLLYPVHEVSVSIMLTLTCVLVLARSLQSTGDIYFNLLASQGRC